VGWHFGSREKTAVELAGEVISAAGGLHGLYDVSVHDSIYKRV
jgi:DNA repair protein RadC